MKSFYILNNTIRDYAWGHPRYIPDMIGFDNPDNGPVAELWMGAHPSAPSLLTDDDGETAGLDAWVAAHSERVLGPQVSERYGRLPFLFKLLAAGKSLSIQVHPDKKSAEEGFARENREGIPLDAPNRNYRDDNHKPEIIMAMTSFTAMIGFRPIKDIVSAFGRLARNGDLPVVPDAMKALAAGSGDALRNFLTELLGSDEAQKKKLLQAALEECAGEDSGWDELQRIWVPRLARQFPGDVGALAPLFLNVVELKPGEALYQPARALHAYLDGFGLELMANSDNVLRGGLTPKNVDVPELMKNLDFVPTRPSVIEVGGGRNPAYFETPAREFALGIASVESGKNAVLPHGTGPAIALSLSGDLRLESEDGEAVLKAGTSAFIPWSSGDLRISGTGKAAIARVGE